ncbi:hypothetical protein [Geotalea uraniireducens]|uniref:hypothetical protein n=1 Tax=Geotalea uraniireducens TaxID=351604 RepID=UPI0018DEC9C8|nr:hypothetical protein [Geotalea uraniireducens]
MSITASGTPCAVYYTQGCAGPDGSGAPGHELYLAHGLSSGSLVAKINDAAPFFIGQSLSFIAGHKNMRLLSKCIANTCEC